MNQKEEKYNDKENGGGGGQPKVEKEETKGNKTLTWITIAMVLAFAVAVLLII